MKRATADEQDVIGSHHTVLRRDRGSFHQGQKVALYALSRDFGCACFLSAGDFVDLVEKHDAVLFGIGQRAQFDFLVVDELSRFLIGDQLERIAYLQLAGACSAAPHVLEHALDLRRQVFHTRRGENFHLGRDLGNFDFNFLVIEIAFAQSLAKLLPCSRIGRRLTR